MSSARRLMKNTLLLSLGGIIMRGIELCFRAYLAVKIGAESMGVYGLVMSAYMVFATVSISGIRFCVTRLCAESVGKGDLYPVKMMRSAFLYSLFFGLMSGGIMLGFAEGISALWIGEEYTSGAVRLLALSLPPMAIQAAIGGYFTGKEKIFRLVAVQFIDSVVRIAVTVWGFSVCDVKKACSVLAAGETAGESICTLIMLVLYFADIYGKKRTSVTRIYGRRILKTALPLAVSAYTRTGLSSLGHMLVPIGLRKSGLGKAGAFSAYGVIHQMAFPIILFPAAFLSALGEVLVPLFTSAQVQGRKMGISYMANRSLRMALIFSTGIAGLMYTSADDLSMIFYKTADAGRYIRMFSFLIPVMYLDSVTDGCLKGLGQQLHSMAFNIADAFLNVVMLYFLLPVYAVNGYIVTVFVCETMNFILSIGRLRRVTQIDANIRVTLTAVLSAAAAQWTAGNFGIYGVMAKMAVFFAVYIGCVYLGNGASRNDFKWFKALYFEKNV